MTLTVGSLFTGIGGIDIGLLSAGMGVEWVCEIDKDVRKVLAHHWPNTPAYDDVKELDATVPRVDVLCGGFPCQDLSVAGRRAGLAGERSGLFHEFMRVAAVLAPRWVLIENVPGLLSSGHRPACAGEGCGGCEPGADMAALTGALADHGYGWCYRVLDAQYFGVAQRRRRVFIVGCLGDPAGAAQVLLEPESCDRDSPPSREAGQGVAGTLGGGSGSRGWAPDTDRMTFVPDVAHRVSNGQSTPANDPDRLSLVAYTVSGSSDVLHTEELAQPIIGRHGDPGAWRGRGAELGEPEVANALRSSGDGHVGDQMGYVLAAHPVAVSENQRGEVLETDYAHQLTSGGGKPGQGYPAVRQGMAVRRLTPLECERLQGFPDGWTDVGISDSARYRLLGNAVAVPVAEWIGRRIVEAAV